MQDTLTFPRIGSPHHRFTSSQSYFTDYSEKNSTVSTPFVSAPSSPGRHCDGGFYFSAPTSPYWAQKSTASNEGGMRQYPPSIPLHWDEKPGTPRRKSSGKKDEAGSFIMTSDFEFSARFAELDDPSMSPTPMSSANELFCNGQIKPLRILTTSMEHPFFSTSRSNMNGHTAYRKNLYEHAASNKPISKHTVGSVPFAFDLSTRREFVGSSNSSVSAPHSPRFSSTLGCRDAPLRGNPDLDSGKSVNSLSAPQSPRSPLNRVKGALCWISPTRIDRAFDTSMCLAARSSQNNAEVSSKIDKAFGISMQVPPEASSHPPVASKQAKKEDFQRTGRSVLSLALRSHGASHRRRRSFSPLRVLQRNDHRPAYPAISSSPTTTPPIAEQEDTHNLSQDLSSKEKQHDDDSTCAQKGPMKRWTLKDLLHRKSGGENRWNSSRSSSRHSGASADSTSSMEKMRRKSSSAGRSSSESLQSFASTHTSRKDVDTSTSTSSSRTPTVVTESVNGFNQADSDKKGIRNFACSVSCQSHNSSAISDAKLKNSTQMGMKAHVQKGNKGRSLSSGEVNIQTERATLCEVNASEVQLNMHKLQLVRGTLCEVSNNNNISNNCRPKSSSQRGLTKHKGNKGCISPHEMHYVMHKQQTEELRKKTFLPYRQGLLGCLGFPSRSYRTVSTLSKTLQSVS